jgi:hypothetical protein
MIFLKYDVCGLPSKSRWLSTHNRDTAEGLQQYIQSMGSMYRNLLSLDANRSETALRSLHDPVDSDKQEEAADELAELIDAAGISEAEKEALMLTFVDEDRKIDRESAADCLDIEVSQVDARIEELLIRLRPSVRR